MAIIKQYCLLIVFSLAAGFCLPAFSDSIAVDPSGYTPSARVLGLGRAFVGLADDASALYLNPAGLSQGNNWKISSMSGTFLSEYQYLSASGSYPTNFGTIGFGFTSYNIGGAPTTTLDASSAPDDPIYVIDNSPGNPPINNFNNLFVLGYSTNLDRFFAKNSLAERTKVGLNLRLYSAGLSGDHIINGTAMGNEVDLGVLHKINSWSSIGISALNLLPYSMGGKITYVGGHSESYPASIKAGIALDVLGKDDAIIRLANGQKLTALFDLDYMPTLKNWPTVYHFGLEYAPVPIIAIRAGIDQTAMGNGLGGFTSASDITTGVGINYVGFRFDYAYHQFSVVPGIDNHSFSLTYSPLSKSISKEPIIIFEPKDKSILFDQSAKVIGKINASDIKLLEVNGNQVTSGKQNSFNVEAPLKIGKNKLSVLSYGEKGKIANPISSQFIRILRAISYPDVPESFWARQQVSLVSMLNIVTGYPDGSFRPEGNISRAEMAALLMRSKGNDNRYPILDNRISNIEPRTSFKDVKSNHWAAGFITDAASAGVVEGYPDRTFRPKGNITRAEGLAMIARFAKITQEAYSFQYFPDVSSSYWASPIIAGSSKAGLLEYLKGQAFEPKRYLTRAEAVEILYRTPFVKGLLEKDLLNWDGY